MITTFLQEFNFVSPAYPVSLERTNLTCQLTIDHGCAEAGTYTGLLRTFRHLEDPRSLNNSFDRFFLGFPCRIFLQYKVKENKILF
jgi:hypothetical protein